jgi:hypothetical protein
VGVGYLAAKQEVLLPLSMLAVTQKSCQVAPGANMCGRYSETAFTMLSFSMLLPSLHQQRSDPRVGRVRARLLDNETS